MASDVQVYGTDWCGLTFSLREFLTNARIAYEFHDVDRDPAASELMLAINDGRRRFPLVFVRERVLTNPTRAELRRVLDDQRIRPAVGARHSA
jgi:mycoredoxin